MVSLQLVLHGCYESSAALIYKIYTSRTTADPEAFFHRGDVHCLLIYDGPGPATRPTACLRAHSMPVT